MSAVVDLSVVVPTVGRMELLQRCLESILACDPAPAEIVVVDQSGGPEVARLAERLSGATAVRVIPCDARNIPIAVNTGFQEATRDLVAVTHDDCTVAPAWAATAARLLAEHPGEMLTGRVSPVGDPKAVPSTRDEPEPHVYAEPSDVWALLPNNMAVERESFLAFGGFDPRFDNAGEDLDVAFRWLVEGRVVRYAPELRVWHHDWRTPAKLRRTWVSYSRGCGIFFAKNLLRGEHRGLMWWLLVSDLKDFARALRDVARTRRVPWWDPRFGTFPGIPLGLLVGLWRFRRG